MRKKIVSILVCAVLIATMFPFIQAEADTLTVYKSAPTKVIDFSEWKVAPSANVTTASRPKFATPPASDAAAANPLYDTSSWDTVPVPGSLLGGLIDLKKYDDVFSPNNEGKKDVMFDNNITKIPDDFSNAWWYSVDFNLDEADIGLFGTLTFKGISYTGRVWVNGQEITHTNRDITSEDELKNRWTAMPGTIPGYNPQGPYTYTDPSGVLIPDASTISRGTWDEYKDTMQGSFRHYDLDVTGKLVAGNNNIKVKVTRGDRSNDFNYNFHDWHMTPVCRNMGITYPATLTLTGAVRLSNPFAAAKVATNLSSADVSFYVDASNMSGSAVSGMVAASVRDPDNKVIKTFTSGTITIPAGAYNREVSFPVQTFSGDDLQLWWPYMSGGQPLYHVDYVFATTSVTVTDNLTHRFGIREISAEVNKFSTHNNAYTMQVFVNHKPITVRGGGFCPYDLYLRQDPLKDQAMIDLNKQMGFNAMRDEGKFFNDYLYDLMDENGIMLITGYMCCDRNEVQVNNWAKAERFVVYEQTYDQIRSLRSHPSMIMWLNGSDYAKDNNTGNVNASNIHHKMLEIEGRLHYYDHGIVMSSASGLNTGGNSGFIGTTGGIEMEHSYDSQSPAFYFASVPATTANSYTGGSFRGAYSFVSEGGGGAGIPTVEGMRRMIPEDSLWPMNVGGVIGSTASTEDPGPYNKWNYHACRGNNNFDKINTFQATTDGAFGGAGSLEEWVAQANLYQYDMQRAQYEAVSKNRYVSATGFINWMLNGTRPVIMWNQFDYDMNPHGSTYGSAKANEPVHIMYDPFAKDISVINSTYDDYGEMTATMVLYDINGKIISNPLEKTVNVVPDGVPSTRVGPRINRTVGKVPTTFDGDNWYNGGFQTVTYEYGNTGNTNSSISTAYGVNRVWARTDISASLIRPTSDVYFMRLELKDKDGNVVSYNTYAVPRRQDAWSGGSTWSRAYTSQTMDWTQLNSLPELEIGKDITFDVSPHTADGIFIVQTVELTNTSGSIAHGVELKSYKAQGDKMLCPATYDDNLITLFPGQTRVITVTHQAAYHNGPLYISVNCFNNLIGGRAQRSGNIYHATDITNGAAGDTTDTQPARTTNHARVRQYAVNDGAFGNGNATAIAATPQGIANNGTTVMDSDTDTSITVAAASGSGAAATGSLTVNLGSVKTFDRTMLRYYGRSGTNMIGGTPNYIRVQVSNTNGNWQDVEVFNSRAGAGAGYAATYDNTGARSPMTNILFKAPVSAQYIRYTFTGLTLGSTAYGSGSGSVSSQLTAARANPTTFTIGGIEVYNSYNYLFVEIEDEGNVGVSGGNIAPVSLSGESTPIERSVKAYIGGSYELTFTPGGKNNSVKVFKDGADISGQLDGMTLTLDDVSANTEIRVVFSESALSTIKLTDWKIACSGSVATSGLPTATNLANTIQPDYDTSAWVSAAVPGSIEGALVDANKYGANVGMKLDPDGKYDVYYDDNFAKVPIGDYANPWWYSNDFTLSQAQAGGKVTLTFKGISYTGRVFVNGNEVINNNISVLSDNELRNRSGSAPNWTYADVTNTIAASASSVGGTGFGINDFNSYSKLFKGAFRTYDLDITEFIEEGDNNVKVLVTRPVYKTDTSDNATTGDFAPFWVDWHPTPADMNGGMIGNAFITTTNNVRLSNPAAASVVATDLNSATVKFYVDVNNMTGTAINGTLKASVYGPDGALVVNLPDTAVTVAANAYCQEVALAPWAAANPQLWWPYLSGDQPLYTIEYSFIASGGVSGKLSHRFGIRQIEQRVTTSNLSSSSNQPQLQLYVNHLPIMSKGGGYCPTDLLLRQSEFNDRACIDLVKSMGMNMIRDEGKFFSENLLDLMDENGILYMTGWCCCDRHQNPNNFTKAERFVTYESLYSQIRTIRSHACAAVWLNGSDAPPDGSNVNGQNVGRKYLEIEGRLRWYEVAVVSCSADSTASNLSGGRSGLHMSSSYDAQSASLKYTSPSHGSLGFISEGHGGPGVPYIESLKRFIPEANLWPYNVGANYNVWNYHSARASFANIDQQQVFVDTTYGASDTIEVANARSQLFQYEIQRASYEALNFYRFNQSTGLINWMLNDARPGIMWNQFDYYMNPFGSTFGAGKANEPLHIMYNPAMISGYNPAGQTVAPGPNSISVINSTREAYAGLTATATIYDIDGSIINTPLVKTVDIRPDGIIAYTGTATNRTVGYTPNGAWITGGFSNYTVPYAQVATGSTGLTVLWTNNDINNSLIKPTSDVYFLRLELADSTGKVLSHNNYAVPRRESVNGTSASWARAAESQMQDLTLLNSLPAIDLQTGLVMTQTDSVKDGDLITQTLSITNNTGIIAYGVDIKAYMDNTCKVLVAPSLYSDNLMIIFPGQTRVVTVTHYADVLDKDSVFTIDCYNNVIQNKPARAGNIYDTVFNRYTAPPTAASATTNLAKGITPTGLTNGANATAIASVALSNAAFTVIDSNLMTVATLATTSTTGFTLDLGAAPVQYDKVMIRWSANTSTGGNPNMLAGVPTTIRVDTSVNNTAWTTNVLTFNNTNARSAMTEIIFPEMQTARYVRFVPNGTVGTAAAYGAVTPNPGGGFRHSVSARNASANWNISSIEIYAYKSSAFIEALSSGSITYGTRSYTMANNALERQLQSGRDGSITFTFTPSGTGGFKVKFETAYPEYPIEVFRDGVRITHLLSGDNELELSGVTAATVISTVYDGTESIILTADRDDYVPGETVNIKANIPASNPVGGTLLIAAYGADGKMVSLQTFSLTKGEIFKTQYTMPSSAVKAKAYLWDADYIPLCTELTIS